MHYSQAFVLAALGIATGADANFWVVKSAISAEITIGPDFDTDWQWKFMDDPESCDEGLDTPSVVGYSDVADKRGMRVEFADQGDDLFSQLDPLEVEWNMDMDGASSHATWYKDRDGHVFDLDGNDIGSCVVIMDYNTDCQPDSPTQVNYQSLLNCLFDTPDWIPDS